VDLLFVHGALQTHAVILSEAKNLCGYEATKTTAAILRFAQNDIGRLG
jgi:hypothetical protein